MSPATPQTRSDAWTPRRDRTLLFVGVFVLVSLVGHVVAFAALEVWARGQPGPTPLPKPVELEIVQVESPPPPEPEPEPEKPEPPPPPPKPKPKPVKPPPIEVAKTKETPPEPPPEEPAPPPPNDTPPPETPPRPVPLIAGISMSSTTSAGDFAAPVGNTSYGKIAAVATDPSEVKQYAAPKYVPIYQVDSEPSVIDEVKIAYPREAQRAGVEGTVVLSIKIDHEGKVVSVKVLDGPGYGLNEAAAEAMKQFKWKPAVRKGEAVITEMTYRYTFYLP